MERSAFAIEFWNNQTLCLIKYNCFQNVRCTSSHTIPLPHLHTPLLTSTLHCFQISPPRHCNGYTQKPIPNTSLHYSNIILKIYAPCLVRRLTDPALAAVPSHLQHGLVLQVNDDAKFYVLHVQWPNMLWKRNISVLWQLIDDLVISIFCYVWDNLALMSL